MKGGGGSVAPAMQEEFRHGRRPIKPHRLHCGVLLGEGGLQGGAEPSAELGGIETVTAVHQFQRPAGLAGAHPGPQQRGAQFFGVEQLVAIAVTAPELERGEGLGAGQCRLQHGADGGGRLFSAEGLRALQPAFTLPGIMEPVFDRIEQVLIGEPGQRLLAIGPEQQPLQGDGLIVTVEVGHQWPMAQQGGTGHGVWQVEMPRSDQQHRAVVCIRCPAGRKGTKPEPLSQQPVQRVMRIGVDKAGAHDGGSSDGWDRSRRSRQTALTPASSTAMVSPWRCTTP